MVGCSRHRGLARTWTANREAEIRTGLVVAENIRWPELVDRFMQAVKAGLVLNSDGAPYKPKARRSLRTNLEALRR